MHEEYKEQLSERVTLTHLRGATATTTDALLLAAFLPRTEGRALELGAGCGIVSILAAARDRFPAADLCERNGTLADLARRNIAENRLTDRLTVVETDLRTLSLPPRYASVFANPPYQRAGDGRPASNPLADIARFERAGTITDFCLAAERSLTSGGSFSLVFPLARRRELDAALAKAGLFPALSVTVYPYPGGEPKLLLLRATREKAEESKGYFILSKQPGGEPTDGALTLYREGILMIEGVSK